MNTNKLNLNIQDLEQSATPDAHCLKKDSRTTACKLPRIIFRTGLFLTAAVLGSSEAYSQYSMGWGGGHGKGWGGGPHFQSNQGKIHVQVNPPNQAQEFFAQERARAAADRRYEANHGTNQPQGNSAPQPRG